MKLYVPVACVALLCSAAGASNETVKLVATDADFFDLFGQTVGVSGTIAIVGAQGDDDNGSISGSAYLFSTVTGQQLAKLLPADGAAVDSFGISVALQGTTAVIGSYRDDDNGNNSGSAYLFDTTTHQQLAKLLASDGAQTDQFGWSVAIDGPLVIVGSPQDDDRGDNSGAAYLFDAGTGQQLAKLVPDDGAAHDQFGWDVGISGATAIVGARLNNANGEFSGAAYLFDATTLQQLAKIAPNDGAESDQFGYSVAIDGTRAVVGAFLDDDNGDASGSAYVFDVVTGGQIARLLPNEGAAGDRFGISVAIHDTLAIVGAHRTDAQGSDSGAVYRFDAVTGVQLERFLPSDGAADDLFGCDVAVEGTTVVVGAYDDDTVVAETGSAYVFRTSEVPSFCDASDGSLAACPCGNPGNPDSGCDIPQGTGGVRFDILVQETSPLNRVTAIGWGFPTMSAPSAVAIRATGLDLGAPIPFGDGVRCVGTPLVRLGVGPALGGVSQHTFGHGSMAGSGTFYYQLWFRSQPTMFCTPEAFNLSNGRSLRW